MATLQRNALAGISETSRRQLTKLHRNTSGLLDVDEAAALLGLDGVRAAKLLAHWSSQGWVRRLRRGLYLLIPLEATSPDDWSADPWVIAERLFKPGYVAGWSACEHWGFTEQIFRDVAVFTAAPIRQRKLLVDQTTFALRKIPKRMLFGLHPVWRTHVKVSVSDPTRTIIDILDDPGWGGGVRHVAQILDAYVSSEHRNETLLLDYVARRGNAAVAKRLGFLWEIIVGRKEDQSFLNQLLKFVGPGYALLDPAVAPRGPFLSKWNLRANVDVARHD